MSSRRIREGARRRAALAGLAAAAGAAVCVAAAGLMAGDVRAEVTRRPEPARLLAARLAGIWDNAVQHQSAPAAWRRPPANDGQPWLDRQHARFRLVHAPGLTPAGGQAVWLEWRAGGPDGPVSRQRLWVFRPVPGGGHVMDFFTLNAPEALNVPEMEARAVLARLGPADVRAYGGDCALPVRRTRDGWEASIPAGCVISARSGRSMRLSARIGVSGRTLTYEEAGTLPDGATAFRVPGAGAYRFEKAAAGGGRDSPR